MANSFLKRGMSYLGLIDNGFDEGGESIPDDRLDPTVDSGEPRDEEGPVRAMFVQRVDPVEREESSNVTLMTPRVMRARSTDSSLHVQAVAPTESVDARQIADKLMARQPVIVHLQAASSDLKRRMIDFCSGATYALGGTMERVAKNVFLITPLDVELSAVERERALLDPGESSAMPVAQAL